MLEHLSICWRRLPTEMLDRSHEVGDFDLLHQLLHLVQLLLSLHVPLDQVHGDARREEHAVRPVIEPLQAEGVVVLLDWDLVVGLLECLVPYGEAVVASSSSWAICPRELRGVARTERTLGTRSVPRNT